MKKLIFSLCFLLLTSCGNDNVVNNSALSYVESNKIKDYIKEYISKNNSNNASGPSSLEMRVLKDDIERLKKEIRQLNSKSMSEIDQVIRDQKPFQEIKPLENGLTFVEKLNPVSFIWNMRDGGKVDIPEMGFIAQELKQVQEETGITVPNLVLETNPDRLEASYGTLLPILVKAVQELSAKVTRLETELSELKK